GRRLRPRDLPPPAGGREGGDPAHPGALRGARAGRRQGGAGLPHPRLGRAHPPERRARGQRSHGGVLEGQDGRRLDVHQGVLLPRRHHPPLEGGRVAADGRLRGPVLRPVPAHGRDLGRAAHHALLPGLHAGDRRRRGGGRPGRTRAQPARGLADAELRPPARRAPEARLGPRRRGRRAHLPVLRGHQAADAHRAGAERGRGAGRAAGTPGLAERGTMSETGSIAPHVRAMLEALGEDPNREGLLKTPERAEKALRFLTQGYGTDTCELLNGALFTVPYDEMVIIKEIDVYSMCEHHLLPFFGKAHVAYIPNGKVVGLSKVPRLVDAFARRLQVQERLTVQIAEAIQEWVKPRGVGVVIEAMHFCMIMRGVEKQNSVAVTPCMLAEMRETLPTREEFLTLIRKKHNGLG